ncbi:DUF2079 domain-containing protein [Planotetraspora sp. A-T 1434]|uniref:DUF2079 domain-containing protein n=1 Tax=Planotetraspora sp. A-T 1434 TaxID=2979219 RepID=UPI0021BF9DFC|nr:DUF2079 domain-containing protein [Planotetraspora sp. A-T 1434]MCT9932743.1 DUF2079 domain-containing protein [Planotetraspora sp. A-T 1434]
MSLARFRAGAYDLVIFDQAVRSYSRFGPPISMIKGVHNGFGPGFSVLGDHWSPILATLAPLYWIHDGPETLLVAQAILLALPIPFLWTYTSRTFGGALTAPGARRAAYCVAVAYAVSWPIAETVAFDFHEAAFVPPLTAILLERHQAGRAGHVTLAAALLLLVKEDMGLLVAGLGLFMITRKDGRRLGAAFVAAGVVTAYAASQLLIPRFGGRADYYWAYSALGGDFPSAARHALTHPGDALGLLVNPPVKARTVALLLLPVLFTALFSPVTLAAIPLLAERMLASSFPNWWVPHYHYGAFVVVVVFAGGVDGARRLAGRLNALPGRRRGRRANAAQWWAAPALAAGLASVPFFAFGGLFTPGFHASTERTRAAEHAVAVVPDGARCEAAGNLAPALSGRTETLLWDRTPRWAPWVVADVRQRTFPFVSVNEQSARVRFLLEHGYRLVFREDGYRVLRRS